MGPEACLTSEGAAGGHGMAVAAKAVLTSPPTQGGSESPLPGERGHPAMWCSDCLAPDGWGTQPPC